MSSQMQLFDGYTIDTQRGSLGGFDIDDEDTENYRADEVLVLVVTATVSGASFKTNPNGDWVRTNKLTTHQVKVASGVMKDEIVEFFNLAGDELPFPKTKPAATRPPQAPSTASTTQAPVQTPVAQASDEDDGDDDDPVDYFGDPKNMEPQGPGQRRDWDEAVARSSQPVARDPALASFLGVGD